MTRIQLQIYTDPGGAEVYVNLRLKQGGHERVAAFVDTGAETSLFPTYFMSFLDYRLAEMSEVIIDQAGISEQVFTAIRAYVRLFLEDALGNITPEFEVPVWFAESDEMLVGFEGILDRAVLHIDMPQRIGWIDLNV
jgi:hypothetical protein